MLIKYLLQTFNRAKQYYLTTILTLSITLAMVLSVFSLVDLVFFAPLPYKNADQLYLMTGTIKLPTGEFDGSNPQLMAYIKKQNNSFSDVANYHRWTDYKLYDQSSRPDVDVILSSNNLFDLLGVEPELGRLFNQSESLGNKQPSVILGYRLWQDQYQADPNIIGKKIQLNLRRFTVIGVAPDNLVLPQYNNINQAVWIPLDMDETFKPKTSVSYMGSYSTVVKLKENTSIDGVKLSSLATEMSTLAAQAAALYTPKVIKDFGIGIKLELFSKALQGDSGKMVIMLLVGVLLLLVIALINLSSMQLARAVSKIKTVAISFAFGASNKQILTESFKHNITVVGIAVVLSLLLTSASFSAIKLLAAGSIQRLDTLSLSFNVFLLSGLLAILIASLYSLIELKVVNEKNLMGSLQSSGKGVGKQMSSGTSHSLIGLQIFFSFIVLIAACHVVLFTLSEALRDNGVNTENKWSLTVNYAQVKKRDERVNLHQSIVSELAKLNTIENFEQTSSPIIPSGLNMGAVYDENSQYIAQSKRTHVSQGYFASLDLSITGEGFKRGDSELENYPVIVNQRLVEQINSNSKDVIGKKISLDGKTFYSIIGVVANNYVAGAKYLEVSEVYTPKTYSGRREYSFLMTIKNSEQLEKQIRDILTKINSRLDIASLSTLDEKYAEKSQRHFIGAWVAILLATVSLIMVAIGINGLVNYMVQVRRYDLGVKLAMGASNERLLKDSLIELMQPVLMSLVFAFSFSFMLIGYSKTQPDLTFSPNWFVIATIMFGFGLVSLLVSFFPVRNILSNDPIKALHNE